MLHRASTARRARVCPYCRPDARARTGSAAARRSGGAVLRVDRRGRRRRGAALRLPQTGAVRYGTPRARASVGAAPSPARPSHRGVTGSPQRFGRTHVPVRHRAAPHLYRVPRGGPLAEAAAVGFVGGYRRPLGWLGASSRARRGVPGRGFGTPGSNARRSPTSAGLDGAARRASEHRGASLGHPTGRCRQPRRGSARPRSITA